jgi:transcriptional regulator GlxA family with amidase domain
MSLQKTDVIRVTTIGMNGCVASAITGPTDLFAAANEVRASAPTTLRENLPQFGWRLAGSQKVTSQSGVVFEPSIPLSRLAESDVIIVPGFGTYNPESRRQVIADNANIIAALASLRGSRSTIIGLCTGTLLLAEAGLLDGRSATTSWWNAVEFRKSYPSVDLNQSQMLVHDDTLITAGAGAAYFDAVLYFLGKQGGSWLAETVANYFVLDQNRRSQSDYILPVHIASTDAVIARADRWLRERFREEGPIPLLAQHLGMSNRSLHRYFVQTVGMSPQRYALTQRMQYARKLIERGHLSVETVALQSGYNDPNSFRRAFKAFFGLNTSAYKRRDRV